MKIEKTFTLNAPVDEVMKVVRERSVIEDNEKSRGALDVKIEDLASDENKHVYRVAVTNHLRTKTGGLDKSKTELNTVTNEWDLKGKTCRWTWEGTNPNASRVKLSGGTILKPNGDNTDMTLVADAEVSIPVIGKTVSKKVGEGFAEEWPKYITQIKKQLGV
jgi:hypothetical protein